MFRGAGMEAGAGHERARGRGFQGGLGVDVGERQYQQQDCQGAEHCGLAARATARANVS